MTSLLTNTSAMNALQTMKSVNKNLNQVQENISTGKKINSAKDNAGIWAVSSIMESDVQGFKAISDSLNMGQATVGVARAGAEQVTTLLNQMKSLIISANQENVDRGKLQSDLANKRDQIAAVVDGSQFNGLNLLKGTGDISVLASLNRTGDGVSTGSITISRQNLEQTAATAPEVIADVMVAGSDGAAVDVADGATETVEFGAAIAEGNKYEIRINDTSFTHVAGADDDQNDVAYALRDKIKQAFGDDIGVAITVDPTGAAVEMELTNDTGGALVVQARGSTNANGGGLSSLAGLDISTASGAADALTAIEGLIQTATDSAAALGSAQKRLEEQSSFMSKLTDSVTEGVGALTDADMEEAAARLQALQTQQQLGLQALSIANSNPQNIMQLFR